MTSAPLRTLIVDDDIAVAGIHGRFVEAHASFAVVGVAHTGAEAVAAIARLDPELVLLDIYLPDFSGLEVLSRIRLEHARHTEVIAVTAARDLASVREARANGVMHYLVKPFTATALRARLDAVAAQHARLRRTPGGVSLDQSAVDAILSGLSPRNALPPKGLSAATLRLVTSTLLDASDDLSASEVAAQIGMSRVAARRYLEHLVETGTAAVEPRYGSAGRPEHRYRAGR
ncbi:response regulator of citrate/malate metabolism [Homoserinimonas aerilata]|uniref:Transcriptional regulatory protein n=1 Tax=Homoserinimonas aerilata TaxID=1162970 RepID=A0A542YJX2_9MICO|nr:response regulator [Homoserinimonas aerilata]TQL48372.1 response regulator of citrate/malate metabolism [Homoserinimonas aerilata]